MLIDFILRIPYYIVRFFVPNSVWDHWQFQCRDVIDRPLVPGHSTPSENKALKDREKKVYRSIKGRLVRARWPYSI